MFLKRSALWVVLVAAAFLSACSSPAALLLSLIPDGTFATLLNNMQDVDSPSTKKLAELGQKEDWNGIAALAQENLSRDPTNSDWWVISGYAAIRLNQLPRANQAFAEAVRLSPDDIDAWNLLGESYRVMGQPDRAVRTLENALRVSQDSPMTYYVMGRSFHDLKRPDRAMPYFEQTVQRAPQFGEGWYAYGQTALSLGRRLEYARAVQALQPLDPAAAQRLAAMEAGAK
ncbi:MAG TPA: tetratricopeptide repeat protein [Burkholderiales bacterium]|nr:tetratricopeptide repeat protein [Burkholderiales bacterium]